MPPLWAEECEWPLKILPAQSTKRQLPPKAGNACIPACFYVYRREFAFVRARCDNLVTMGSRARAKKLAGQNRPVKQIMKTGAILAFFLAGSLMVRADDDTFTLPELVQGAQQWAQENLDTNVLNALSDVDERTVQQFFLEIQQSFQGDYVVNVAALRQTAQTVLPLLESREETQPYAAWLKSRMDYLDVADEIRLTIPPPAPGTNQPPQPLPNPPPQTERRLWLKKVSASSWPALAKEYVPELKPVFITQKVPRNWSGWRKWNQDLTGVP